MSSTRVLTSTRVLLPGGAGPVPGHVVISGKRIIAAAAGPAPSDLPDDAVVSDYGDKLILPGVVDAHVHINEPGRSHWEGFDTATRAAAVGGVSTVCDMPLNSVPSTVTEDALNVKTSFAKGCVWIDVAFWGGVVPGNADDLGPLLDAGARGFKCFLCDSGVDEFERSDAATVTKAADTLAAHPRSSIFLFHAEIFPEHTHAHGSDAEACTGGDGGDTGAAAAEENDKSGDAADAGDCRKFSSFLATRPASMEVDGIDMVIRECERSGQPCHVVHLSAAEALPAIRAARARGIPLSVETCPHYLVLDADEVPEGATEYKCCPPVRNKANRELLWEALRDGTIDMVVSDHSPSVDALKCPAEGDFLRAWGGIASLQFSLCVMHDACVTRGIPVETLVKWMCERTSDHLGLGGHKGRLAPGYDADVVVFDENGTTTIESSGIQHKNKSTPFLGRVLKGKVLETIVGGNTVAKEGKIVAESPHGSLLLQPRDMKKAKANAQRD